MALLASYWLLVESFVIPHGFLKWFYLSFYIHPFFLVFCQAFLRLNQLMVFLFYPLTPAFRLTLFVLGSIQRVVVFLFYYIRPAKSDVFYDAVEPEECTVVVSCKNYSTHLASDHDVVNYIFEDAASDESMEEMNRDCCSVQDSWLNHYLCSDHYTSSLFVYLASESVESSHDHDGDDDQFVHGTAEDAPDPILLTISPNDIVLSSDFDETLSPPEVILDQGCGDLPLTQQSIERREVEVVDTFQQKYTSRMKFFNILYQERLQGIKAISNELLSSSPSLFDCIEATDCPMQYKAWSRAARKRLLRSLECDLEMISVAQCCLFWGTLDHQYHKIESLNCRKILLLFKNDISGKFQEVQIQLERFVEDEKSGSSRNNTSKRLSFQSLLQLPDVTGFVVMEEEEEMMGEEYYCIKPSQLLDAIDKCIKAFWSYIKTDEKKSIWKYKRISRTRPPVEDPQDLELLYNVVKILDKKWRLMRGMQGKRKCCMRRKVKPVVEEDEKRNAAFAIIDLQLVQRLLKLSLISKSQLQWCQQRLLNLDFIQDRVFRPPINHLFPLP